MDKVRLAIVGCGTISQLNARGYLARGYLSNPECDVVALCDPVRERAERRAAEWGIRPRIYERFEDLIDAADIDAVELLTPTSLHAGQAVAALDAGKHVSCQKPICNTAAEADQIIAAVNRGKSIFRVTENFLYYAPIVKARELLHSGVIGEASMVRVRTVWGSFKHGAIALEPDALTWRRDSVANAGGLAFDDGWHKYATAMWWLGDVEKVSAIMSRTGDFIVEAPCRGDLEVPGTRLPRGLRVHKRRRDAHQNALLPHRRVLRDPGSERSDLGHAVHGRDAGHGAGHAGEGQ